MIPLLVESAAIKRRKHWRLIRGTAGNNQAIPGCLVIPPKGGKTPMTSAGFLLLYR